MPVTTFDTTQANEEKKSFYQKRVRFREGRTIRIGFPLNNLHTAELHWRQRGGYFVCEKGDCCRENKRTHRMFSLPVVLYGESAGHGNIISNPATWEIWWWQFPLQKYRQLMNVFKVVSHHRPDVMLRCDVERFQKVDMAPCMGEPWWRGNQELWVSRAEDMFKRLPLWEGYAREVYPDASPLNRVQLLMAPPDEDPPSPSIRTSGQRLALLME